MSILIDKRQLVIPGELIAKGDYIAGDNVYKHGENVFALKIGLMEISGKKVSVIPLKGCYIPHIGDIVIGKVLDIGISGWLVDIFSPYPALLPVSETLAPRLPPTKMDLTKFYNVNDLIAAKVISFDRTKDPLLSTKEPGLGKISSGKLIKFSPSKIPRLIGKKGSMINMLKKETKSQIIMGQNGIIVVSNKSQDNEAITISAIRMIEEEAHTQGLTDRVKEFIRREIKK
ncbi:MAG: exosome complex RNA-binding protein Rrp4 [Candidatus Bathyarchaeia archaeon]